MTLPIRKKLIEVSIPLEAINAESARRKQKAPKGYPTAIHKYWAQRPLAACRAILFAQLVDDPSSWPDRFSTDLMQDEERRRLHKVMEQMLLWESSNDDQIMTAARWEVARSLAWGRGEEPPPPDEPSAVLDYLRRNAPPLYDPFSGGASIPLEAQRLGLSVIGSDLNPVAVLIGKAMVEIPPKFAGLPPVNPASDAQAARGGVWQGRGAQGLADDVRYYGRWMRDEAARRIGHLYPDITLQDGSKATVTAWLWARTVRSPDPAAKGAMVPLVTSFVLSNKEGRKVWVEPVIDSTVSNGWRFDVRSGALSKPEEDRLRKGTKTARGSNFVCVLTGSAIGGDYTKAESIAGRMGTRLMAIVAEGARSRLYLSPTADHEAIAVQADPAWEPKGELPDDPRNFWITLYGMRTFASLFTRRQLTALTTFSDLVAEAREQVLVDASKSILADDSNPLHAGGVGRTAYADAIATYLALVVDRMVFYGSSLCGWLAKDNAMGKSMPQQAIAMSWDFAEGNPLGKSSADILTCAKAVADCVSELQQTNGGTVNQADACYVSYPSGCVISTDPPYYNNFAYADLSDFFYCWLKPILNTIYPELFRRIVTPKDAELVATPYRHGGDVAAEKFFMDGMGDALKKMSAAGGSIPTVIYYAYKQQEQSDIGVTSAGWAGFLQAIVDAGFSIDGTWPVRTENPSRSIAQGTNALASSIVLVCRKRSSDAHVGTRTDFIRALKREMPSAIDTIRKAGVGPVDMQQSVIGPGMGVFTRFVRVLEDDDSTMSVKTALTLINRVWEEIENELDAAFDPATQVALAWFATYGFDAKPSGELITLANAKNIPLESLFSSDVFQNLHGRAGLIARTELPSGWTPATDRELTVWECVQHSARALAAADGGAEAAAALVGQMGRMAADARTLAYRLFEIATKKGWAAEALVYNELAEEWPHLQDLAPSDGSRGGAGAQGDMLRELR